MIRLLSILSLFFFFVFSIEKAHAQSIEKYLNAADEIYDSNPDSSFQLCCAAENLQNQEEDNSLAGKIAVCKGRYYILKTDYGNATNELNKAILFYQEKKDLLALSGVYSLKSILLDRVGEPEQAHLFLLKSYQIAKQEGSVSAQVHRLLNLTLDYLVENDLDSAYYYLIELDQLKNNIEGTSQYYYYQNWGHYYQLNQDYSKAISFEKKALQIAELYDMLDSKATIYKMLSSSYLANGEEEKAVENAKLSYNISVKNNLIYEKSEALEVLVEIYKHKQDYKTAFNYFQELSLVQKEILNIEKLNATSKMENKLAIAQKEMEGKIAVAEKEKIIAEQQLSIQKNELETAEVKSQNLILYFIVAIAILLIIFTTWIYLRTKKLNVAIQEQKSIIEQKNEYLNEAYKNINDSIQYSKHIQQAMLPDDTLFSANSVDHFILYRPKDIVSGDFYWAEQIDNTFYFSVVDCTGHGVPGAMVSIIGFNGLNRCLKEMHLTQTGEILDHLSEFVESTLTNDRNNIKDGMDMAICAINKTKEQHDNVNIQFSGANNGVYVVSGGELVEVKPDKQPIGHYEDKKAFQTQQLNLKKGDCVYLFSDGYADQFGGPKGKKMKYKTFKDELIKVANQSMEQQKTHLNNFFEKWMGEHEQIDDVCVIGIRL